MPKRRDAKIGQRDGLSRTDCYKVNKLYGCFEISPYEKLKYESFCDILGLWARKRFAATSSSDNILAESNKKKRFNNINYVVPTYLKFYPLIKSTTISSFALL